MNAEQIYIAIAILVLACIAVLVYLKRKGKKSKPLSPLAALAFGFVVAGIVFGDSRWVGYSLMGIGVALAVADLLIQRKK